MFWPDTEGADRAHQHHDHQRLLAGDGRRTTARRPIGSPAPATRPHPPILLGGSGEQRTLRLVAQHADACNLPDIPDGGASVSTRLEPCETADFVERAYALAPLGIDHLVVLTRGPWTAERLTVLASAIPAVAADRDKES